MDSHLSKLKQIEFDLRQELEESPLFKKWQSVKNTIDLFEFQIPPKVELEVTRSKLAPKKGRKKINIPTEYNKELTWKEKILFVLHKINAGSLIDIVEHLKQIDSALMLEMDHKTLTKRITVTVSKMKIDDDLLDVRQEEGKSVYFIK